VDEEGNYEQIGVQASQPKPGDVVLETQTEFSVAMSYYDVAKVNILDRIGGLLGFVSSKITPNLHTEGKEVWCWRGRLAYIEEVNKYIHLHGEHSA